MFHLNTSVCGIVSIHSCVQRNSLLGWVATGDHHQHLLLLHHGATQLPSLIKPRECTTKPDKQSHHHHHRHHQHHMFLPTSKCLDWQSTILQRINQDYTRFVRLKKSNTNVFHGLCVIWMSHLFQQLIKFWKDKTGNYPTINKEIISLEMLNFFDSESLIFTQFHNFTN